MTAPPDDRRIDRSVLEEEREFFVRSLRDLEAERAAGDIDDLDYRSLRDDYTVRAAEVVRRLAAIEGQARPEGSGAGSADAAATGHEVPVDGATTFGGGTDDRPRSDPSDTVSAAAGSGSAADGTSPGTSPDEPVAAPSSEVDGRGRLPGPPEPVVGRRRRRGFIAAAALIVIGGVTFAVVGLSNPSESSATRVDNLDVAAESAYGNGQYTKAIQDYEAALRLEPTNVLTLTGEGELLVEVGGAGHNQGALSLGLTRLQSAEISDPAYGPAYGARGIGYYDEADYAAAVPQFETYLADTPKVSWSAAIVSELAAAKKKLAAKG